MRTVKLEAIPELEHWLQSGSKPSYANLDKPTKEAIRHQRLKDQHHLCAYCCDLMILSNPSTDSKYPTIEHIKPQSKYPDLDCEPNNLVLVERRCNDAKKGKEVALTPLMPECEIEIKLLSSGKVRGYTDRSKELINAVGLNHDALVNARKRVLAEVGRRINAGDQPKEVHDDYGHIDDKGAMLAFAPLIQRHLQNREI